MNDPSIHDIIANSHIQENKIVVDRDLSDYLGSLNAAVIASVFLTRSRPDVGNGWFILSYSDWERLTFLTTRKIRYTIPLMAVFGFITKTTDTSKTGWAKAYKLDRDVFMPKYIEFLKHRNPAKWVVPEWVFEDDPTQQTNERLCQNVKGYDKLSKPLTKLAHMSTENQGSSRTHIHAGTTPSYDGVEDKSINASDNTLILQLTDTEKPLSNNHGGVVGGSGGQKGNSRTRTGKSTDKPLGFAPIGMFEEAYLLFMGVPVPKLSQDRCINLNRIGSKIGKDVFIDVLNVFFNDSPPWPVKENGYDCGTFIKHIDKFVGLSVRPVKAQNAEQLVRNSTSSLSPAIKALAREQARKIYGDAADE